MGTTITVPGAQGTDQQWTREPASLLNALGAELLRAGGRTADVEADLRDVGARYDMRVPSFIVPTGLLVQVDQASKEADGEIDFAPVSGGDLRLDQVQSLQDLIVRLRHEPVSFDEARVALEHERSMPERFSSAASVLGYALLTLGLGAMLHATTTAMAGYAVLGATVGLLRLLTSRYWPATGPVVPVAAAVLVTALAQYFAGPLLHEAPENIFIPPLIAFLPGAALTMGAIELAVGDVLSGVARLAGAVNVLMLLALGILVTTDTVHLRPSAPPAPEQLGGWAGWCGVPLLAGGTLYYSAPARTLGWLTCALLVERAVQTAGAAVGETAGADVRQLEQNLVDLGYAKGLDLKVDDKFTGATAVAVKRWQKALDLEEDQRLPQRPRATRADQQPHRPVRPPRPPRRAAGPTPCRTLARPGRRTASRHRPRRRRRETSRCHRPRRTRLDGRQRRTRAVARGPRHPPTQRTCPRDRRHRTRRRPAGRRAPRRRRHPRHRLPTRPPRSRRRRPSRRRSRLRIRATQGWPAVVPVVWAAAGPVMAVAVGTIAGLYPALCAVRMAPTTALRAA
ncbi:threonine/serine exporter family protein [Kitasatospora sp. NPDC098663]|uniref:threonine/serine exporter family protein n=1 Tax=Kitasatospora sp. NPDC098663 TaxID=3364096 RepID=UPI0037F911B5